MHLAVAILRVQEGLDYSGFIEEDQFQAEKLLEVKKKSGIPRNQSEGQLSQGAISLILIVILSRLQFSLCSLLS